MEAGAPPWLFPPVQRGHRESRAPRRHSCFTFIASPSCNNHRVSRTPGLIEDPTALDGSRIDVSARIGWLLRTSRTSRGVDLSTMAARLTALGLSISAASVSRLETAGHRDGSLIDGYEQALGLAVGHLRSVIDTLCRTFDYAPHDRRPDPAPLALAEFSNLVDTVSRPGPTGGDWLRFARQHERPRGYGLTSSQMAPLLRALSSELCRSVGPSYTARYEALARLRSSAYAEVVELVARDLVMAPDAQVVYDLASAVAERPSRGLVDWAGELVNQDSSILVRVGDILLQNMRASGRLTAADWASLDTALLAAFQRHADHPGNRAVLTRLFRTLPPALRAELRPRLAGLLEPAPAAEDWSRTRRNSRLESATRVAVEATTALGLPDEPLLARLLFEALFDFRGPRSSTACLVLMGSPYACAVGRALVDLAGSAGDLETRTNAASVAGMIYLPDPLPDLAAWFASGDPALVRSGYLLTGHAGSLLSDDQLTAGLAGDPADQRLVLYGAGMAEDPRLAAISTDERQPHAVRAAAAYWLREGGRVVR